MTVSKMTSIIHETYYISRPVSDPRPHIVDHISTRCGSQTIAKIITSSTLLYDIYRYSFNGLYKPTSTQLGVSTLCHQSSSSSLAHSGSCIIIYHYLSWSFRRYYLYKKDIGCMTYIYMYEFIYI